MRRRWLDGASSSQRSAIIRFDDAPVLAVVMTFSIIFTFTDFQLVYAITRGGSNQLHHLLATLAFPAGIAAVSSVRVPHRSLHDPFLVFATLFSYFGLARAMAARK